MYSKHILLSINYLQLMIDYLDHPTLLVICSFLDDTDNVSLTSSCYHLYLLRKWIEYDLEAPLDQIKDLVYFENFKNIKITSSSLDWYLDNIKNIRAKKLVFECLYAPETNDEIPSSVHSIVIHNCLRNNRIDITPICTTRNFYNCTNCFPHLLYDDDMYYLNNAEKQRISQFICDKYEIELESYREYFRMLSDRMNRLSKHLDNVINRNCYRANFFEQSVNHVQYIGRKIRKTNINENVINKVPEIITAKSPKSITKSICSYEKKKIHSRIPKNQKFPKKNRFIHK